MDRDRIAESLDNPMARPDPATLRGPQRYDPAGDEWALRVGGRERAKPAMSSRPWADRNPRPLRFEA